MSATAPSIHAAAAANLAGDRAGEVVIGVSGLHKRYGELEAVRGIDLKVRRGEIFAFLGPNGAGKTTTVEILEGFRGRSAGQVSVLGVDPAHADRHWRDRVGVVLQESQPEPGLRVRECLQLYAGYYSHPRQLEETIALVGLQPQAVDEPTTGFDPSARRAAWQVVAGLRTLGKTVFLTTHYMDEAEHLADRIAVIAAGRIVAQGTPQTLGGRDRLPATISFTLPTGVTPQALPADLQARAERDGDRLVLTSQHPLVHVRRLADWALARGLDLPDLDVRRPSLEDVYLHLTRDN